jgi:hypothetical protein
MPLTTRRQFVQQMAFAAAFSGIPIRVLAGTRRMFEAREQNAARSLRRRSGRNCPRRTP